MSHSPAISASLSRLAKMPVPPISERDARFVSPSETMGTSSTGRPAIFASASAT